MRMHFDHDTVTKWVRANTNLAKRLRNLTDADIARRMGFKNRLTISFFRNGNPVPFRYRLVNIRFLIRLANALQVTPAQLLTQPDNLELALMKKKTGRPRRKPLTTRSRKRWQTITKLAGL